MPASESPFSNPVGIPAPLGPDPTNSPEVHGDYSDRLRGGPPTTPCRGIFELQLLFPWTASLPERLQQGLLWDPSIPPHTVQIPGQLLLYTGKANLQSLDSVLLSLQSNLEDHIIALGIRRSEDHDILKGDLCSHLCVEAWNGQLQGVSVAPTVVLGASCDGFQNQVSQNQSGEERNRIVGGSPFQRIQSYRIRTMTACTC